ncbi:LysR family transcriptional regulator [Novosphingobium sp. JCM 18896]|uniref:LysR family transcriptional regulator n=1 Tax=Novosphingobium sp. JCM 18896 TaxID=2989731 RepID=UPI0022225F7B|nr:LysR family transcriptional regulator [Novosphingobium sp. JCM 18896]MCW1431689.1 LysR family transcriptional regulator [Novosphingobium sp. JCM 18896]
MTQWNIDIRAARHLVALARHLSFTHAAEELGITQSALSRSIQRFEDSIQVRLFDRNRGGVHLTVVGKELAKRASALVDEANAFERTVQQSARGSQDSVTFGMGHLPAKALLPQVMAQELADNPTLHIKTFVRTSETLLSMLLLDEIEFLLCADALVPEGAPVKRSPIGVYTSDQLVRRGHPLLDPTERRQPHEFPWIITKQVVAEQPLDELHSLSQLRQKPQLEIEDLDCLSSIAQNTDAIWVTSRATAVRELEAGLLCCLPLEPANEGPIIRLMMYSRSDRSLSPAALRLRDRFRTVAKS